MPVIFMLLQKWTFDGKFQICQISLLPTDSVILDHTVCVIRSSHIYQKNPTIFRVFIFFGKDAFPNVIYHFKFSLYCIPVVFL
jgi:hypothetical protein